MSEEDIEEYIIDTKEGKGHFTLRVSLVEERIKLLITSTERPNKKYYNLVRLSQLKEACNAFDKINTIKDALNIIKTNIESGNILISEENIDVIDVKFVLKINGKNYSPFFIGLPIDNDEDTTSNINTSEKNDDKNNYEVLPTKFDYQGNKEAEMKYGKSTKSTTEYIKPIIQADVKEPNLVLEYIEPILQVHYPDGTTKSTALPARLQTEDGKEPNIAPEQLKSIHEQISANFSQSLIDYEKEKSRANSVSRKKPNDFSRQTHNVPSISNFNNINTNISNNFSNNNDINNINAVRSAMKPNINMNINMNMNTMNNYNIRQVRTHFNPYDNNIEERNTTNNINNINNMNMPLSPRDNYFNMNLRQNKLINKGLSDYSISSMPNKPLVVPNYNMGIVPNTTIKTSQSNSGSPLIQEVPNLGSNNNISGFNNYNNYSYNNIIMLQKGLSKSSSSPALQPLGNVNHNFYKQNQGQALYYRQNNFNNFNNMINTNNNINNNFQQKNLQNQINNVNLQMNLNNNKINNTHTSFMNYTHNPHLVKNNQNYNTGVNNINNINNNIMPQNILTRNYSNQNAFQNYRQMNQINPMTQSTDEIRYQQYLNQKRLQEQKNQILQRTKMNNLNYNNINNLNNISRNPNLNNNTNYAQVNILEQQIKARNQQVKNTEPMNNYRNKINTINITNPSLKQSRSQQVMAVKNEITQQQIALAELASRQNQKNPENFNTNLVSLNQKFLDSEGNEETQSQYERESNNIKPQQQIINPNLKIENEKNSEKIEKNEKNDGVEKIPPPNTTPPEDEEPEDPEAEKVFGLKIGDKILIIFRNGLLRGIIHKYKEIDEVVSKIQLKLMAGAKFMLLYRASTDGDKAKIFHQKCDKHNMTLVLVETTKGVRFGGFTTKSWDGNCVKKIDNEAFVFSFDKKKSYDVIKNEHAVGGYPKFGPVFFGCQIRIYDNFFTKGGTTCNRGLNYNTKEDFELNNGEQKYIVKEIEVYDIESIEV